MFNKNWDIVLEEEINKEYFKELMNKVELEYENKTIYPLRENLFRAFKLTDYDEVKVVILGQDPYHEEGQANGLAFSVYKNIKAPKSLVNIFKELNNDLNDFDEPSKDLFNWAEQGVLLLNTILTVEKGLAGSHETIGWQRFTDKVIEVLNKKETPVVFILWGNNAREKKKLITNKNHLIIESSHPSPLGAYRSFFGSRPFSRTNEFLIKNKIKPINWK